MPITCKVTCRGYMAGAEVSDVDLEALTRRIVAEEIGRSEFFVEIVDGGALLGTVHTGLLYDADTGASADRWCVTFADATKNGRWCLSLPEGPGKYKWYVFCGGETEILESCAVPLPAVFEAIQQCCREGGRSERLHWVGIKQAMNL